MRTLPLSILTLLALSTLSIQCTPPLPPNPASPPMLGIDANRFHGKTFLVVNVVDGDTIDIALSLTDPNRTRIRLLGVDTPETVHPRMSVQYFGPAASRFVTTVTLNRRVIVHLDPLSDIRGKYGRLLAYIELDDSSILNERLLALGLAYAETRFPHSHKLRYKLLESAAQATTTGLWKNVTFEQLPPWLQRTNPDILNTPSTNPPRSKLMGTPLPPNEPGNNCPNCWGPAKPFGDGNTPKVLTVQLFDLAQGINWIPALQKLLLTPHLLIQGPLPCNYGVEDAEFAWSWVWTPTRTAAEVLHLETDSRAFLASVGTLCSTAFDNDNIQPIGNYAFNGSIETTWSLAGL